MGNAPPSNGNPRDDPRSVSSVMGTNGHHHGAGGPYGSNIPGGNQHQQQHQKQHQHQHQHQLSRQQHPQHGGGGGGGYNMQESNSDASMSNVEENSQHQQQRRDGSGPIGSTTGSSSAHNPNTSNNTNTNNNSNNAPSSSSSSSTKQQQQQQQQQQQNLQLTLANLAAADDDTVPTVFRWEHGGRQVYITGTFNGWSRQIPMHRSGNDFTYIHNLKRGKHAFKFIVDDEWRFAPDQPTVADIEGRINNFIDVTDFKPYTGDKDFEREKAAAYYSKSRTVKKVTTAANGGAPSGANPAGGEGEDVPIDGAAPGAAGDGTSSATAPDTFTDPDGEVFTHNMPDLDEYTKDPPPLPPHLRHIILNKPPQLSDTAALPVPQHVALNHLYCTAIKDNMMVLGVTQRFRTKFVTTVYYSPELSKT